MLQPGDTELELTLPPGYRGLLMPRNRQAKQGVPARAGVTDPDHQEGSAPLLHTGGREEYI